MNILAVSKATCASVKAIRDWVSKGCPHQRTPTGEYRFDLAEVQRWRVDNLPGHSSYAAARARKEAANAELRELQLRQKKGELVTRAAVTQAVFTMVRAARDRMANIPDRIAGLLAAERNQEKIHRMLTQEIYLALEDLSRGSPIIPAGPVPTRPAASTHGAAHSAPRRRRAH